MTYWSKCGPDSVVNGFTVRFYCAGEDTSPVGNASAIDEETDQQILDDIASGKLLWFQMKCVASRGGIELGTDYLGGCCYADVAEFFHPQGYAPQMVDAAVEEATATLASLDTADQ